MDLTASQVRWIIQVSQELVSLGQPLDEAGDETLIDIIVDENTPSPPEIIDHHLLEAKLEEAMSTLTPREARILRLRFGLEDGYQYTLEEVGRMFGLTRERIRQLQQIALTKLHHSPCSGELREYLD